MTQAIINRLSKLDSCAVSDALDGRGLQAVALGIGALSIQRRISGRAVTIQLGTADGRPTTRHLCTSAVEASGKGDILVIAHGGRTDVAGWGGILSLAASVRRIEGVVIDGACRDIDESREMQFPVYGRCAVSVTARSRIIEYSWNVPIRFAGVEVCPDDLVVADGSGVAFIPAREAEAVVAAAEQIVEKERRMAADVIAGKSVSVVMGTDYETMLKAGKP